MTDETKITVLPFVDPRKSRTRSAAQRNSHQKRLKESREAKIDALMFDESKPDEDALLEITKQRIEDASNAPIYKKHHFIGDKRR